MHEVVLADTVHAFRAHQLSVETCICVKLSQILVLQVLVHHKLVEPTSASALPIRNVLAVSL